MVRFMNGGNKLIDKIEITLKNRNTGDLYPIYMDAYDTPLSRKWLTHLNQLLTDNYFLEKNYCFFGFINSERDGPYIVDQINKSIDYINNDSSIDYHIDDWYTMENSIQNGPVGDELDGGKIIQEHYNMLHRYFEELQGTAGEGGTLSPHYLNANEEERYYIRQLNLLCHEFESWALSKRKSVYLPEWQRPSQLMCWLNAPRFELDEQDYEDFGIETLNRSLGGVYVGVNKAVGKHHWEVFMDEGSEYGRNKDELTTIAMRSQTQAAGDFDIEWANNPGQFKWQQKLMGEFRTWLINNNFDPEDKALTIGHPKCGQIDLQQSFDTDNYKHIWSVLENHLDVYSIKTSDAYAEFGYNWDDTDFIQRQISSAHPVMTANVTGEQDLHPVIGTSDKSPLGAVDYAENVWNSSSDEVVEHEMNDDAIVQQAEILFGLNVHAEETIPSVHVDNDVPSSKIPNDNARIKELKEKINQIFKEYGV